MRVDRAEPCPGARVSGLGAALHDALGSGRYFTWWSFVVALAASSTVLSPWSLLYSERPGPAVLVAAATTLALAVAFVPVIVAERGIVHRGTRRITVVLGVIAGAIAEPYMSDLIARVLLGATSPPVSLTRLATNVIVWPVVLSLVAMATTRYRSARASAARFEAAARTLERLGQRPAHADARTRETITGIAAGLRARLIGLLEGPIDFDAVRDFAEAVRAASHDLDHRARAVAKEDAASPGEPLPARPASDRRSHARRLLAPPPYLLVGIFYFVANAPYTVAIAGPNVLLIAAIVELLACLGADVLSRRLAVGRAPRVRDAMFLLSWALAGAVVTSVGLLVLPDSVGAVRLVPLIALPGLAVVGGLATDAVEGSLAQAARLAQALAAIGVIAATTTATPRAPLLAASHLLHGRVQGRCVIFAARVDEHTPTASEIDGFRRDVDEALDDLLKLAQHRPVADGYHLDDVLAAWADVIEVMSEIDAAAARALGAAEVSQRVADIVGEAFVNAVKYSTARRAHLRIATRADGEALVVCVATPGELHDGDGDGIGIASLGGEAHLEQQGDDVVLAASVPLARPRERRMSARRGR